MIKKYLLSMMAAVALLVGVSSCAVDDNPITSGQNAEQGLSPEEQALVGLWWDEFDYSDVTETGVPFSRVLLAVDVKANHTGCLYLGVFDDASDEPLVTYGGPLDAGFNWALLPDGRVQLSNPASGESIALSRTRGADGGNYGKGMTNVSGTNVNYADGNMSVTNNNYSGTLAKADSVRQADIEQQITSKVAVIPMTIEALTAGTVKVNMSSTLSTGMIYSVNSGEKTLITNSTDIPVNAGDKVQFYGNGTKTQVYGDYPQVNILGSGDGFKCKVYGNIMSLLDEENFATKTDLPDNDYLFYSLFDNNTALIDAGNLLLPATTLFKRCYCAMFSGCTALTTAPDLPATTLAERCYFYMFSGCTSLTSAPKLLPATGAVEECYGYMFKDCTSLTSAPDLPATRLAGSSYEGMFYGCKNLKSVKCLATSGINENYSTINWLKNVAAKGTLYIASGTGAKWQQGVDGIPSGWTAKYPDGTTWSLPHPLSKATADDLLKPVSADGNIYESKTAIANAGVTPIAMIAHMGKSGNSNQFLAIALSNDADDCLHYSQAESIVKKKTAPSGASWRIPTIDHWKAMFKGCGGTDTHFMPLDDAIERAGGTRLARGLDNYWTSTMYSDIDTWVWTVSIGSFSSNINAYYSWDEKEGSWNYIRSVLVFSN